MESLEREAGMPETRHTRPLGVSVGLRRRPDGVHFRNDHSAEDNASNNAASSDVECIVKDLIPQQILSQRSYLS